MMHYKKGQNIEEELTKDNLPFNDCLPKEQNFLWMQVRGGTKVNNVLTYAKNALDKGEYRTIFWTGVAGGVVKTVSCAEIIKRSYALYQLTRVNYTSIDEYWNPQTEGLEELIVNRKVPVIHILMSLDPIDSSVSSVQKPKTTTDFWFDANKNNSKQSRGAQQREMGHNQNQRASLKSKKQQQRKSSPEEKTSPDNEKQSEQLDASKERAEKNTPPSEKSARRPRKPIKQISTPQARHKQKTHERKGEKPSSSSDSK